VKTLKVVLFILLFLSFGISGASATGIPVLYDWSFNINGAVYDLGDSSSVPGLNDTAFDYFTGLGTLVFTVGPGSAGNNYLGAFFDHEIYPDDGNGNPDFSAGVFDDEEGADAGTTAAGQSWEIDEPGWGNSGKGYIGDIYLNFASSALDGTILEDTFIPDSGSAPEDISMAMAWNFDLSQNDYFADISFVLSDTMPSSFHLKQFDGDGAIYLSSNINVVPEPGTILLVGTGLAGLAGWRRRRSKK
jgi:hypothetical protein